MRQGLPEAPNTVRTAATNHHAPRRAAPPRLPLGAAIQPPGEPPISRAYPDFDAQEQSPNQDGRAKRLPLTAPWRVFLSHTSELRVHPEPGRSYVDRAERAVSAAGHAIVDMIDFASEDQRPASRCVEEVSRCDVYVGIFGLRYGSPVRDQPEVSYTELEFDTATARGIPRLVFVVDTRSKKLEMPAEALVDLDYGQRQAAFLRRVNDCGLMVQRFCNPDHLGLLVERSLRTLEQRSSRGLAQVPRAAQPSPARRDWSWPTAWEFRSYREEKRRQFVGRAWLFEEVRAWANAAITALVAHPS